MFLFIKKSVSALQSVKGCITSNTSCLIGLPSALMSAKHIY